MPIKLIGGSYETSIFPGGEVHVRITYPSNTVEADIRSSADVMLLLLMCDALKRMGMPVVNLMIPYFPYARQDRVCNNGESFSLKVMADLINFLGAKSVLIYDPHSDVTPALINNCTVVPQHKIVEPEILEGKTLICPDAGAEKKILKFKRPYVMCTKKRDPVTGEILSTEIYSLGSLEGHNTIIIDDICDGGRTFIEIAKALRMLGVASVELYVTHGIFSKGFDVFKGLIDKVYFYKDGVVQCKQIL